MLSDITKFFKRKSDLILLAAVVFLLCLLSFGLGILAQFYLQKTPLEIEIPAGE